MDAAAQRAHRANAANPADVCTRAAAVVPLAIWAVIVSIWLVVLR